MGRYFNIGGPCNPADHYTLSAMARLSIEVRDCGITVDCASIERLGMINLWSRGGGISSAEIVDDVPSHGELTE